MGQDFSKYDVNEKEFRTFINAALDLVSDLRIPFGLIGRDFYKSEKQIFILKGRGGYDDLADSTKASGSRARKRAKAGVSGLYPILVETGELRDSLLSPTASGAFFVRKKNFLLIGTTVDHGIYHQSDAPRGRIPKRKFLFIDGQGPGFPGSKIFSGRSERWTNIIGNFIKQSIGKRGWDKPVFFK